MSCDDNVCAECGRVCRDNPPDPDPAEGWEPPQRPWRTGMPAETLHAAPEESDSEAV